MAELSLEPKISRREQMAFWVCLGMSVFQMYAAGVGLLQTPVQRSVHLGFTLVIIYLLYPASRRPWAGPLDGALIAASIIGTGYIAVFCDAIAMRGGQVQPWEMVLGFTSMLVVFEAGRRVVGKPLPIIAAIFLLYCYYGRSAPWIFEHRGYSLERIVQHMYLTTEGIFGVALGVSSTYLFMFILFGAFLSNVGGARLFNNLALSLTGRLSGGPAKVAVIASGLMGSINGSSIANVATTGALTIPMMKKAGYKPEDAAAVEATASTGGQLIPPIMGAGAFIMSEFLNVPYVTVAAAALIPAFLYYGAVFLNVHFMAKRYRLGGLSGGEKVGRILKEDGHLMLPIILIVAMLVLHYTPLKAAFWAIVALVFVCALKKSTRMGPVDLAGTMAEGARSAVGTSIACAVVGFIVGSFSLTALGLALSGNIVELTGGLLFPTLLMSMLACLVLGMGLPTTANYIVTSTIIVPILVKMNVAGLSAHLFVFYFGIMADITPPVCLASFTAAGIASANSTRAGMRAFLFALPSFLLPYLFIYAPEILIINADFISVLKITVFAAAGLTAVCVAVQGWMWKPLSPVVRLFYAGAGVACYWPTTESSLAGLAALALLIGYCRLTGKGRTVALVTNNA